MHRLIATTALSLSTSTFAASNFMLPITSEVAQAMSQLGLTPEALAVIDVHGGEITTLLDRLRAEYTQYESLIEILQTLSEAISNERVANSTLRADPDDADAQTLLAQSVTAAQRARTSAEQARTTLVARLLDELADQSLVAQVIHTEQNLLRLPPAYRLAVDTQYGAKTLCWALELEEAVEQIDDPEAEMPQEATNSINAAHSQNDVQLGKVRAQTYAVLNQAAIDQWVLSNQ